MSRQPSELPSAQELLGKIQSRSGRSLGAMIEIADRCNEVCVHCYQVQGLKGEMSTEQVKSLIDELADLGVLILTLSGGEATLRKDFLELVAHGRRRGFMMRLFTNGLTMTPRLAEQLRELAVSQVEISLYSHHAPVHDWVTGVPGAWERTVRGIRELRKRGISVRVKTPLMSVNEDHYETYLDFVRNDLGADPTLDPTSMIPREGGDREPERFNISEAGLRRVLEDEQLLRRPSRAEAEANFAEREPGPPCGAAESIHIEANGELRPCTSLEVDLGNAHDEGVAGALEGERARGIRSLTWRDLHGCRDCDVRPYCGRCYANALAEAGDALAPYASACRTALAHYEWLSEGGRMEMQPAEEPGRDAAVGPYREVSPGVLRPIPDEVTAGDEALARHLTWVRQAPSSDPPATAQAGELVQIRRPGRRKQGATRVPEPDAAGVDTA